MHNLLAVKCTNVQLNGFLQMCAPMWPAPRSTFPSSQKVPSCFFSVITTIILMPTTSSFFILNLMSSQSYWYSSVFLHVSVVLFYFIFIFWHVVRSINILQLVYPFSCWWKFRLFPVFVTYNKHLWTFFPKVFCGHEFSSLKYIVRSGITG